MTCTFRRVRQVLARAPAYDREAIAASGVFIVPRATFKLLYCFFVIEHGRAGSCASTLPATRLRSVQSRFR